MKALKAFLSRQKRLSKQIPYRNRRIRFFILFLLSFIVFSNMYAFNNPQALQDSIMNDLSITQTQFNMLYTIIALPNIVFPFFIGIIIDYLGIRIAIISLTFCVVLFQTVVAIGGAYKSYQIMLIGRMLFGIAIQSLNVAQTCFVSYWFLGKQLALSLGLATTLPQLGNALNSLVTPYIYDRTKNLGSPLFVSVGICCLSFLCACTAAYIDKRADKADQQRNLRLETQSQYNQSQVEVQSIKLKDLKQLRKIFWLIICLCMFAIAQYIPFLDNVNQLLQTRFCFSQISAGKNITITYLVTALLGFPLGIVVDKIGFKRYLIMIGMSFFMFAHLVIYLIPQCMDKQLQANWSQASWGLLLLGFAYCFYANCILPSIPTVVSRKITGTAFGIMLVVQNFSMAVCPIIAAQLIEHSQNKEIGYKKSSLFYTILGVLGFLISLSLFCIDSKQKRNLDKSSRQKKLKAVQILPYLQYAEEGNNSKMMKQMNLKQKLIGSQMQIKKQKEQKQLKLRLEAYKSMQIQL